MCPISTDGYRLFLLSAFLSEHIAEVTIFIQKKANKNDKLGSCIIRKTKRFAFSERTA